VSLLSASQLTSFFRLRAIRRSGMSAGSLAWMAIPNGTDNTATRVGRQKLTTPLTD